MLAKRLVSIFMCVLFLVMMSACQSNNADDADSTENNSDSLADNVTDVYDNEHSSTPLSEDETVTSTTTAVSDDNTTSVLQETVETTTAATTQKVDKGPASWSVKEIVDFYKAAAVKTNPAVKSQRNIELEKISVNNGEYEGLFDFITPRMSKLLANNSEEVDGITGGFKNLSAADVKSAKAYKSGVNTVIEMTMKNQTSGACDDALSGSVGHAITAVGDISVVTKQLDDLGIPLELSEKDTKIYYTKPTVKVVVNSEGKIINGTWQYTVDIQMNNYKAFGTAVDTTSVVMVNTITLNGGFKK